MKYLIVALMLMASNAFASGKLAVGGQFNVNSEQVTPTVGLSVYEKLVDDLALNSWAGLGEQPFELKEDVRWYTVKVD